MLHEQLVFQELDHRLGLVHAEMRVVLDRVGHDLEVISDGDRLLARLGHLPEDCFPVVVEALVGDLVKEPRKRRAGVITGHAPHCRTGGDVGRLRLRKPSLGLGRGRLCVAREVVEVRAARLQLALVDRVERIVDVPLRELVLRRSGRRRLPAARAAGLAGRRRLRRRRARGPTLAALGRDHVQRK